MEYSNYAIDPSGKIVYIGASIRGIYNSIHTVWGIGEHGFLHGAGAYLQRSNESFIFDEPHYWEIERYYELKNKFDNLQ